MIKAMVLSIIIFCWGGTMHVKAYKNYSIALNYQVNPNDLFFYESDNTYRTVQHNC